MLEKIFLTLILVFFIFAFAVKNIITFIKSKQSIKGKSTKLTLSILFSTIIYSIILFEIWYPITEYLVSLSFLKIYWLKYIAYALIFFGFVLGLLALKDLKDSWRVGIKYEQKTTLMTSGIYAISRNPYFFSYDILILGYFLVFPSSVVFSLYLVLAIVFHLMILEEEAYLLTVHGDSYLNYKKKVGRYIF